MANDKNHHGARDDERQQEGGERQGRGGGQQGMQAGGHDGMQRGGNEGRNDGPRGQGDGQSGPQQTVADVALRGAALLFDVQLDAARSLWQAQARTAAMLGMPDFSHLFNVGDDRGRSILSSSTEQIVNTMRHATQTMMAVQREVSRLAERQAIGITDQLRQQVMQLGRQTDRGLQEIRRMTEEQIRASEQQQRRAEARGRGEEGGDDGQGRMEQGGREMAEGAQRAAGHHEGDQRPSADERQARERAKARA